MTIDDNVQKGLFIRAIGKAINIADYVANVPKLAIVAIAVPLIIAAGTVKADPIDPFSYLQSSYTKKATISNPHTQWGSITGATGIDNGSKAIFLWDSGAAQIYNSDMSSVLGTIDFGITGATGITEVPATLYNFGAKYAVSGIGGIGFYDASGNPVGAKNVYSSNNVTDLTWDNKHQRLIVGTTGGVGIFNDNGTLSDFGPGNAQGIKYISLPSDTQDMLEGNYIFGKINADGSLDLVTGGFATNLGSSLTTGIAYTKDNVIMAVQGGMFVYDKLAFQDRMDYSVPEPATLALLGAGGALLSRRGRQK